MTGTSMREEHSRAGRRVLQKESPPFRARRTSRTQSAVAATVAGVRGVLQITHHSLLELIRALPVAPDMSMTRPFQRRRRTISLARRCASFGSNRSILLMSSQRSFAARSAANFFSSPTMVRASLTGSASGSGGAISMRCNKTRVRCRCFRNRIPSPAPSAAPQSVPVCPPSRNCAPVRQRRRPSLDAML